MNDERDFQTRQAAHRDHATWELQHEAWLEEAAGWVRGVDEHRKTLERLGNGLDEEQVGIDGHVERIRRHEGTIARHDEPEHVEHEAAARLHLTEDATHARLAERQKQLGKRLALIAELFPEVD